MNSDKLCFFFFRPKENKHFKENITVTGEQIKLAPKDTFSLKFLVKV